jgi:hypothetical protein
MGQLWTENMNVLYDGPFKGKRVGEVLRENPDYVIHRYLTHADHGGITANQYDSAIATIDNGWSTDSWDVEPEDIDYIAHERHRLRHDKSGGYYSSSAIYN